MHDLPKLPNEVVRASVETKRFYLRTRRYREEGRYRPLQETAERLVRRWHRHSRDTITGEPYVDVAEDARSFLEGGCVVRISVRRIPLGQDLGLPAILMTPTDVVEFEAIDGRYLSRADIWDRLVQG